MKKKFTNYLLFGLFLLSGSGLIAQNVFQGTAATLSTPSNWSLGLPDGSTVTLEDITFNGTGNAEQAITNDLAATTRNRISFLSGANSKTITGGTNTFQDFGASTARILNNSGVNQIISFPIALNSDLEINTVGSNNNTLTFNGAISSAGGTRTITINAQGNVIINGDILDGSGKINIIKTGTGNLTFTGQKDFTGTFVVIGGIVSINETIGSERITMGNGTSLQIIKAGQVTLKNLIIESGANYALTSAATNVRITDTLSLGTSTSTGSNAASQFTYDATAVLRYTGPTAQTVTPREWKAGTLDIVVNRPFDIIVDNGPSGIVSLPAGTTNRYVPHNLTIKTGGSISLGFNQLDIGNDLVSDGTVIGGQRTSMTFNGTSNSTLRMRQRNLAIPAQRYYNTLRLVVMRNDSKLTLMDTLVISAGTDLFGTNQGQLQLIGEGTQLDATDQLLVIESNIFGYNSRITTVSSTLPVPIVGDIVLERYVPLSNTNLNGRAWRFISIPFKGTRPLGKNLAGEDWPANRVKNKDGSNIATPAQIAGKGTVVTGRQINVSTATSWGFDSWNALGTISNSSIRMFEEDPAGGNFSGASTTNTFTSLATNPLSTTLDNARPGYMLYVRGDRTTTEPGAGPTNLRFVGRRQNVGFTGTFLISGLDNAKEVVFGNPFACDFDVQRLTSQNSSKVQNAFWIWDANINDYGGWRIVEQVAENIWSLDGADLPPSAYSILPGQAILLLPLGPSDSTLAYDENMKADEIATTAIRPFEVNDLRSSLSIRYNKERNDGFNVQLNTVSVILKPEYSNAFGDSRDIDMVPPFGSSYNLSIFSADHYMALEGRKEFKAGDKISFYTGGLNVGNFSFSFIPRSLGSITVEAYLVDKFLSTETKINLLETTDYNYSVTSDVNSSSPLRFEVIFKEASILPVNFTGITAEELQGNVNVKWNTATERGVRHYEIQHSVNGRDFGKAGIVTARNLGAANYTFLHQQPGNGNHFYRILSEDVDGTSTLSQVVKVNIGNGKPAFTVFPTLIRENRVTLQFTGLTKGRYTLQLSDMSGKVLLSQNVDHNGGSASQSLVLPAALSNGSYNLKLTGDNVNFVERIVKQ